MIDLVVKNGKIVNSTGVISAGLGINEGKIVAIATEENLPEAKQTIDASGKYILPGLIDPHVHLGYSTGKPNAPDRIFVQSNFEEAYAREARTESGAALGGGVTTIGIFLRHVERGTVDIFEEYRRLFQQNAVCDGFLHHKVVNEVGMDDIHRCPELGINSFKFYPGYKGPQANSYGMIHADNGWLFRGFDKVSQLKGSVWGMVHSEDGEILVVLREKLEKSGRQDLGAWRETRPNFVEAISVANCINIAKATGCPLYVVHVTTAEAVDILRQAKSEGVSVKGEVCVQNLTHTTDEPIPLFRDNPALGCMNPPLRDRTSIDKLWNGIKDGTIDALASDTVVSTRVEKGNNIWAAPQGLGNTTEMILPIMLSEGVNKGRITLQKLVEVCSQNAAEIFGLFPQKGIIALGSDADLVLVDLQKKTKITSQNLHSACDWSIYDGWDITGWPVLTILRGQIAMKDGTILAKRSVGKLLYCRV